MTTTSIDAPRHLRTHNATLNGTTINGFASTEKTIAIGQLDSLYRLARINLVGWPLDTTAERMSALDLIAHNAALNIRCETDSTITRKFGMNNTAEDRERIVAFELLRDDTREVLRDVTRTIGHANLAGRIAWLSRNGGR